MYCQGLRRIKGFNVSSTHCSYLVVFSFVFNVPLVYLKFRAVYINDGAVGIGLVLFCLLLKKWPRGTALNLVLNLSNTNRTKAIRLLVPRLSGQRKPADSAFCLVRCRTESRIPRGLRTLSVVSKVFTIVAIALSRKIPRTNTGCFSAK